MKMDGKDCLAELLKLVPATWAHIEWIRNQRNRPELMKYFRQTEYLTFNNQRDWFGNLNKKNVRLFVVAKDGNYIGYAGLNPIDWRHNHTEFGIFIIPEEQGKGYSKFIMKELLKVAFEELKLNKVYSDVLNYPEESRFSFYESLGFKKEGVLRQQYLKDGRWIDSIQFSMLKKEWEELDDSKGQDKLEPKQEELAFSEPI